MAHDDEDLWFVQLSTGAVRAMTLDDLDAAYQSGAIDEGTLVRRDGQPTWTKLSDELGASEPASSESSHTPSVQPIVLDFDADDFAPARSSKKRVLVGFGVVAAAIALAVLGATKLGGVHTEVNASIANAVQAPVLPPSDPQPTAQKATLTEEQKKALADKDAELQQKMNQKRRDRASTSTPTTHTTQPPPFHDNGDVYDPLNSKL